MLNAIRTHPELAIFLTLAAGFVIGRIRIGSFKLGNVVGTLVAGVLIGQLDIKVDPTVKAVFFSLFLFATGYKVGPQFLRSGDVVAIAARRRVLLGGSLPLGEEVEDPALLDFPMATLDVVVTKREVAEQPLSALAQQHGRGVALVKLIRGRSLHCQSLSRSIITLAASAAMLWAPAASSAQGMENTRSVTFAVGTGLSLGGNVITEAVGRINGTPAVVVEQGYGNHFSDALRLRVTGTRGLDFNKEAFVTFAYNKMNATERITGSVGGYPLYTRFSNTSALDFEGGLRYYFLPEGPTRTYVAGAAGVRFQDRIGATIRVLEVGLTLDDLDYFEDSILFVFGGDAGISRDLSDTIAVGAEIGLRYQPKFSPAPVLPGTGLEGINDTSSRVGLPVSAFITWRF